MNNMYGYKEIRQVEMSALRKLCIKRDWFTKADNEEYSQFLNYSKKDNITTDDLVEMATMVMSFSDTDMECTSIMFELNTVCYTYFEEC